MSQFPLSFLEQDDLYLEDFGALLENEFDEFLTNDGIKFCGQLWAERIKIVSGWHVLAEFVSGAYRSAPAAIAMTVGKGRHIHMATCAPSMPQFFRWILGEFSISATTSDNLELHLTPLVDASRKFLAAINFGQTSQSFELLNMVQGICFRLAEDQTVISREITNRAITNLGPREIGIFELH